MYGKFIPIQIDRYWRNIVEFIPKMYDKEKGNLIGTWKELTILNQWKLIGLIKAR